MSLTTMYPAKNNSPKTVLAEDITADATSLTLADTSVLPAAPNLMVLGINEDAEIVKYTVISGDVVSGLVRGVNGTTPGAWAHDTIVARNFTAQDAEAFRENILDLDDRKADANNVYSTSEVDALLSAKQDTLTFDNVPVSGSSNPVKSGGLYTELAGKAAATHNHDDRYYTESEIDAAMAKEIMYFTSQAVSTGNNSQIMRIPASGTNSNISTDTVVLECTFAAAGNVTSNVSWTSYNGYITFTGTCTAATTANVTLGKKGN